MQTTEKTARRTLIRSGWLPLVMAVLAPGLVRAEEPKESPVVTALKSLRLGAYAQVYAAAWDEDTDTFSLRRARIALSGELVKNLRFRLNFDVVKSPALLDAEVEFEPSKIVGLKFGQFRLPFSLESFTSTSDLDMVNRSIVVDTLAPGRDNGSSGRDIGLAFFGNYSVLEYMFGLFNGAGINKTDTNDHKDWSGRVILRPVKFLSVGGSLYRGMQSASPSVPLVRRDKEGLEAALTVKGFSIKSEYIHAQDDIVSKAGWYAQAGLFALPGKLQTLLRYDFLDLDRAVPADAKNVITVGVNWFIKGRTKLQVNYELHRLEAGGTEKSGLLAQFQAGF
jgi:hypothetical protein